jgi:uncharacterized protein
MTLVLRDHEIAIVRRILRRHLSGEYKVFVFGSRTGGPVKPWSDLDLVIEGPEPIPLETMGALNHEFDESNLIWKVDLVDRTTVSEAFGTIIDAGKVPFL